MTADEKVIELDTIPGMGGMLVRAAITRKKAQQQPAFKPICVCASGITVDKDRLEKFNAVCGFNDSVEGDSGKAATISMPYPHIMAFALHMQLMLDERFPFTPMGAVHIHNRIRQQRPLSVDEVLDFEVRLGECERVEKGTEVGIVTEVSVGGELVWDDLSIMLIRKNGTGIKKEKQKTADSPAFEHSLQWQLAANKGRDYAAASGDYNPIHLYPLTAKLMGFKRQIMHGMWSKSRALAHLLPNDYADAASIAVDFKLPIFLPSTVTLLYSTDSAGSQFEMRDEAAEKPHMTGELTLGAGIGA